MSICGRPLIAVIARLVRNCALERAVHYSRDSSNKKAEPLEYSSFVIPGRREAASPESITTSQEYGFRARAKWRAPE